MVLAFRFRSELPGMPQGQPSLQSDDGHREPDPLDPTSQGAPGCGPRPGADADRDGRDRRPGLQRGSRPRGVDPPAPRLPHRALPAPVDRHHRRQRQHRPDVGHRVPPGRRARRRERAVHLDQKGRGRALARGVDGAAQRRVVAYMDVDLSTDLDALLPLVAPLVPATATSPSAPGWRRARVSCAGRSARRSRGPTTCSSARRCGAGSPTPSAASRRCGPTSPAPCCPLVEDQGWFFDTELLVLAEHNGLRIHEVPVDWVDDPDSRVDVVGTALADLRGVWRMVAVRAATVLRRAGRPRRTPMVLARRSRGRSRGRPRPASSCGSPRSAS